MTQHEVDSCRLRLSPSDKVLDRLRCLPTSWDVLHRHITSVTAAANDDDDVVMATSDTCCITSEAHRCDKCPQNDTHYTCYPVIFPQIKSPVSEAVTNQCRLKAELAAIIITTNVVLQSLLHNDSLSNAHRHGTMSNCSNMYKLSHLLCLECGKTKWFKYTAYTWHSLAVNTFTCCSTVKFN